MLETYGYAAQNASSKLKPFTFQRRKPGPRDVHIEILYCGICHSDIHQARNEWKSSIFPMVPGHEIIGRVLGTGKAVKRFKAGDFAGVGCMVDSCRKCTNCRAGEEQFCANIISFTYNGTEQDGKTPTYGGYSNQIVVNEDFVLKIAKNAPLAGTAPLLCAGITTYSPLKHFGVGRGTKAAVIGLGGLGHVAVKLAVSMGARVTVLSTSKSKERDARRLGAHAFAVTKDERKMKELAGSLDFILDTASAPHDINFYLNLLGTNGTLAMVGVPEKPFALEAFPLIMKRRRIAGSLIGGIRETQEMLDYCAKKKITADVEIIPIQKVNEAYERTVKGDVRYRFVIDMGSLKGK